MPWKLWMEYDMTTQNSDIDLYQRTSTLPLGKREGMQKKGYYFKYYAKHIFIIFMHNCSLQLV